MSQLSSICNGIDMSATTDALRADTRYINTIDNVFPAITPAGIAAAEILKTLTGKITTTTRQDPSRNRVAHHPCTRSDRWGSRRLARSRDPHRLRRRKIAPSHVNRVYSRVERAGAGAPHGIRFRWCRAEGRGGC